MAVVRTIPTDLRIRTPLFVHPGTPFLIDLRRVESRLALCSGAERLCCGLFVGDLAVGAVAAEEEEVDERGAEGGEGGEDAERGDGEAEVGIGDQAD